MRNSLSPAGFRGPARCLTPALIRRRHPPGSMGPAQDLALLRYSCALQIAESGPLVATGAVLFTPE